MAEQSKPSKPSKPLQFSAMLCDLNNPTCYDDPFYVSGTAEALTQWLKTLPAGAVIEVIVKPAEE